MFNSSEFPGVSQKLSSLIRVRRELLWIPHWLESEVSPTDVCIQLAASLEDIRNTGDTGDGESLIRAIIESYGVNLIEADVFAQRYSKTIEDILLG